MPWGGLPLQRCEEHRADFHEETGVWWASWGWVCKSVWRQRGCVEGSLQQKADSECDSKSEGQGIREKLWLSSELGRSGGEEKN